jgi:uncharacterized protein (DUF885 family)
VAEPGTAYTVGLVEFEELCRQPTAKHGEDFDLKSFHQAVLENGSMSLEVLRNTLADYLEGAYAHSQPFQNPFYPALIAR